jgi:hypothetical protein
VAKLDCAIVSRSCSMGNVVNPPDAMAEMGGFLVQSVGGDRQRPGHRRIYLMREQSGNWTRPVTNETAVIELMKSLDFEVINPASLEFLDQVRLFSEAAIVVSAHGSALANLIFAPKGCIVIDLMPEGWTQYEYSYRWIYRLTNLLDQAYILQLMPLDDEGSDSANGQQPTLGQPFSSKADLEALENAVRLSLGSRETQV